MPFIGMWSIGLFSRADKRDYRDVDGLTLWEDGDMVTGFDGPGWPSGGREGR